MIEGSVRGACFIPVYIIRVFRQFHLEKFNEERRKENALFESIRFPFLAIRQIELPIIPHMLTSILLNFLV
ncbi:hypothetical protein AC739_12235 [Planococcus glaciei]|uniref:hypothetical protein n=1 Tax=Planococcus glaciei TaxID=459472 RepID=UPI00069D7398|nr:hypothetical protein [Planococcus glaciei]KOF10023.1 hypothetical protein AC739_12235 [Planococcus glaciei]